jgi:hypothetical protein
MSVTIPEHFGMNRYYNVRERWLKTLEDEDYKQTCGCYREENSTGGNEYCALGVAELLMRKELGGERIMICIKEQLLAYYGLTENGFQKVVSLNDAVWWKFPAIAGYIRTHPKEFFHE